MSKRNDDTSSLSHTKWNCQHHIVFCPNTEEKQYTETYGRKDISLRQWDLIKRQ